MKKNLFDSRLSGGGRVIASLKEAVDWVEGKNVAVRVTAPPVPSKTPAPAKLIDLRFVPRSPQPIENAHFELRNARQIRVVRE